MAVILSFMFFPPPTPNLMIRNVFRGFSEAQPKSFLDQFIGAPCVGHRATVALCKSSATGAVRGEVRALSVCVFRFGPNNGHASIGWACPFGATFRLMRCSKQSHLFDHLVGRTSKESGCQARDALAVFRLTTREELGRLIDREASG